MTSAAAVVAEALGVGGVELGVPLAKLLSRPVRGQQYRGEIGVDQQMPDHLGRGHEPGGQAVGTVEFGAESPCFAGPAGQIPQLTDQRERVRIAAHEEGALFGDGPVGLAEQVVWTDPHAFAKLGQAEPDHGLAQGDPLGERDRKSTRLNSSHPSISYAVFCLKKKNKTQTHCDLIKKKKKQT